MNIEVGSIKQYNRNRGFGFVSRTFTQGPDVFFHISSLDQRIKDLTEQHTNKSLLGLFHFWYKYEPSPKGIRVCEVLPPHNIPDEVGDALPSLISKVESIWRYKKSDRPLWLYDVSVVLMGSERAAEMRSLSLREQIKNIEKENVIQARKFVRHKRQKNVVRDRSEVSEIHKRKKNVAQSQKIMDEEYEKLLAEISDKGFTKSKEVSAYIIRNRLGNKYKNISGKLTMEKDGREWAFKGGFPTDIYAKLCSDLGLGHQDSGARVIDFESFKDLR